MRDTWLMSESLTLSQSNLHILTNWLLGHEDDIATGREDFGMLFCAFRELLGREPETR